MRVFVTGATGFIGSALVKELIDAGHQVLGLARSDAGAEALRTAGAEVQRGELKDLESLRSGARSADAVIHLAFIHDFSKFQENCEADRRAVEAMGETLVGTDKLLMVTSGTGMASSGPGVAATEDAKHASSKVIPRGATEEAVEALRARGVRAVVVRLPQVHDTLKQGLVTYAIQIAREKGVSAYVGDGQNRWPAAHLSDVARLYKLALEKNVAGVNYHAVAEEGVTVKAMAEAISKGLKVPVVSLTPEEAKGHFGWLAMFAGMDFPASSAKTREQLGWEPTGPGILTDLENMRY